MKRFFVVLIAAVAINYFYPQLLSPVWDFADKAKNAVYGLTAYPNINKPPSNAWEMVNDHTFGYKVLKSKLPALVYFDAANGCRGGDVVWERIRRQHKGQIDLFYVDAAMNPQLSRTYDVRKEVVFALFEQGRLVKRTEAKDIIRRFTSPDPQKPGARVFNKKGASDDFFNALQAETEKFAGLR